MRINEKWPLLDIGSENSIFHIAHYIFHIAYCIIHIAHCTLHISHCKLFNPHCTLHISHCLLHNSHCLLHNSQCTLHVAHCIAFLNLQMLRKKTLVPSFHELKCKKSFHPNLHKKIVFLVLKNRAMS